MRYALFFILLIIFHSVTAQTVNQHGQLKVFGKQLVSEKGKPVVLRGMSFGWHNFWPRFYNEETVDWLVKDWKSTVIRGAIGVEPDAGYLHDKEGAIKKMEAVVDGSVKSGVYVIIDWHSHNINLKEAKEFFTHMAKKYGHLPNVIYEIFNEPDYETWPEVKAYSIDLIKTIRAIDPDNIILIGSPHWDQDVHIVADDPITGYDNLMYTLHFYAATHKQELRDRGDYALSKGLPLFISESAGMEATGDGPINEKEWENWINWCEKNKISWITWSVSDKDETCSVLQKSANSNGQWKITDLKESGIKARALLLKYHKK